MSRAREAAIAASYKSLKEDFVSNLTGGTISEINLVTAVAPVSVILWSVLQSRQHFFKQYAPLAFAVDFLLNVCAILLATTLYASNPVLLNLLLLAPSLLVYALPTPPAPKKAKVPPSAKSTKSESQNPLPRKPFLTTYRGAMMAITCLAILAVDFRIFPRRFAKVENWGTSLMDVGVGSFVFSAGVVAARPILKAQIAGTITGLGARLYTSIRHSVPLLVLGFVRLWSVKGLDYAEHTSEYGVHWNFFFTLGFLPPFLAIFQTLFEYIPSYALLAVLLGGAYQALLEFTRLKAYVLTAPRVDLLSQNREGIFSFFGYLAIFLAGQGTGIFVLPRKIQATGSGWQQRKRLLLTLSAWSAFWVLLFLGTTSYKFGLSLSVSRRLANLPYFLWISAFNTVQLLAFCAIETAFFPAVYNMGASKKEEEDVYMSSTSRILNAFNRNGLAVFLVANLGTGAVNMGIRTLDVKDGVAMGVLVAYALALTGVAMGLDMYGIDLRL